MKTYKTKSKLYEIRKTDTDFPKVKIASSKDAEKFVRQFYRGDIGIYESVFILLLNRANNTVGFAKISQGGITGSVVDVKIILRYVVEDLASGVILCHNHPSGNLKPSGADMAITKKVKEALSLVDSNLLDHLILTEEGYYSMADDCVL
jgi:DNA repair protein RadC